MSKEWSSGLTFASDAQRGFAVGRILYRLDKCAIMCDLSILPARLHQVCPFRISWSACPDPSGRLIPTLLAWLLYFKHKSNQFKKPVTLQNTLIQRTNSPCADDHPCELVHLFHLSGGILQILERSVHA